MKMRPSTPVSIDPPDDEVVDDGVELEKQSWYHGLIVREDIAIMLNNTTGTKH